MLRAKKRGPLALRRVALTAAESQKLEVCTSLLSEVGAVNPRTRVQLSL